MDRKSKVRKFYEQEYLRFRELDGWEDPIIDFKYKNQIGRTGYSIDEDMTDKEIKNYYEKISNKEIPSPLSVQVSKVEKVPNNLLKACDRINWYLKHCRGSLTVIKVLVDHTPTFAICIQGCVGDGWDNSGHFIEVWDNSGELIGSAYPPCIDDPDPSIWNWKNRVIKSSDFHAITPIWEQELFLNGERYIEYL